LKRFFDETVRRCGSALQTFTVNLPENQMPDNPVAYPKMVTCTNPYQREAAQTPKRSATASAAARESFESITIEHYARPIGWGRLVKYLKDEGHRFVRYAVVRHFGDFSIYTKSKAEARKIGNKVFLYLKDRLDLPINREKSLRGAAVYADLPISSF
jgi:hypothetical protein